MIGKIILLVFASLAMLLMLNFLLSELMCHIKICRAKKRLEKLKSKSKELEEEDAMGNQK